ncbi:MAG: M10 family metallopeptidase C-terminal domain-containing protein [Hyphomicrobiaceae bacterium]|nr:M10 family metallopeptidase C-terminal domain-containing protein [Hyphomicrobiaceae bacterium]
MRTMSAHQEGPSVMAAMTVYEQLVLELVNRARLDPAGEAARLGIGLNDGVSGAQITTAAKQVLAGNSFLVDAARDHSRWMLDTDTFSHTGAGGSTPTARVREAGYTLSGSWTKGENIAWAGSTGQIDLASYSQRLHDNLFRSPGHRANLLNDGYREVGLGELSGDFAGYNAAMLTQNFARSGSSYFITGVAITDTDGDGFYDIGEARSGVAVTVTGQGSSSQAVATTQAAGGYAVAVSSGTHTVTFSGGGLPGPVSVMVAAGAANAKVDIAGTATILSSATTTLGAGARALTLLGVAALNGTGNGEANTLTGNKGANVLSGAGGSDTLSGLAGDDTLDGGEGTDTALYLGRRSDYTVTANPDGSFSVRDSSPGDGLNEGTDRLYAIEVLRFHASGETMTLGAALPELPPPPSPPVDTPPAGDPPADDPPPSAAATPGPDHLDGTTGNDIIDALGGADVVRAGDGNDTVYGNIGNDALYAGAGNDRLYGGPGLDRLFGDGGDDVIFGGSDNDVAMGGDGNDRLFGEAGNDTLRGDAGADWLTGGLGRDVLYGGSGRDRYDYNAPSESRGTSRDLIADFQRRLDDIDVSSVDANTTVAGNQRFAFIGDNPFSGVAGQLRADVVGGMVRVTGDLNGDARADFTIDVAGSAPLVAGDFFL